MLTRMTPRRVMSCASTALLTAILCLSGVGAAYAADSFEGTGGDNTWQTARDVSSYLSGNWWEDDTHWFGSTPRSEAHVIDWVDDGDAIDPPSSDEDWVKFQFTSGDYSGGYSYLFEAVAVDRLVDPVIEIYGPDAAVPTQPGDLIASSVDPTEVTETDPKAVDANDDSLWFNDRGASVSFMPDKTGWYFVRVRPYYQYEGGPLEPGFRAGVGRYRLRFKVGQMTRVSGSNRIRTAVEISKERFPSAGPESKAALLASAYSFPDALSGSTLAGALGSPILLTKGTELSSEVRAEIDRLNVETVYILGGITAVNNVVATSVGKIPVGSGYVRTIRLPGTKREDTARLVALEAAKKTETSNIAFLVNADKFPDALAASPMATYNVAPMLLTPTDKLDSATRRALTDPKLGIRDVVIVGGPAAISNGVATEVAQILGGTSHIRRIQGNTRYETARDFGIWATGWVAGPTKHALTVGTQANPKALDTLDFNRIGLASGEDFPDALAGGVYCGLSRAPILLTKPGVMSPAVLDILDVSPVGSRDDYWGAAPYVFVRSYVFGGSAAVNDAVFRTFDIWTGPGPIAR